MTNNFTPTVVTHPKPSMKIDLPFFKRVGFGFNLFTNIVKGTKTSISEVSDSTYMSPLQPLVPVAPELKGRQWDFPVGYNINYQPRGYGTGLRPFGELRALSLNSEIFRIAIETRKNQVASLRWQIGYKDKDDSGDQHDDPRIKELTEFFQRPDKLQDWDDWVRQILEEVYVTDAVSIYRVKTKGGENGKRPYAFELIDGSTIFPFIEDDGRTPMPPSPAYQQIIKGMPAVDYTTDELLYAPSNRRVYTPYGYSVVEQIINSCRTDIQRIKYQLAYFTTGSMPDAYAIMGDKMTQDQIEAFERRFNPLFSYYTLMFP